MTKRSEAKYKIDRRMGQNIWGRPKSPVNRREYGPGQHGQRRKGKLSDSGVQLRAKPKLRGYYGNISERQFHGIYDEAIRMKGDSGAHMIGLLERRLDALIYRAKLVPTVFAARQFISHGHIKVNGRRVRIASYRVKVGDLVEVKEKSKQIALVLESVGLPERDVPDYIEVDHSKMTAMLIRIPQLGDVPYPVQMEPHLVVEFYSGDDGDLKRSRTSARIELDHEVRLHLHGVGHVAALRAADELRGHLRVVDLDIVRHVALGQPDRFEHQRDLFRFLLDLDEIADLDAIARNRDAPAVDLDVAMADELTRREYRRHQLRPVDQGVEPALEQPDHVGTGIALHADGFVVDAVELALCNIAVIAPQFLLGAQLHAVVGKLAFAAWAVLAGTILAAVHGALGPAPPVLPPSPVRP